MTLKSLAEYAILGTLITGPKHGYEIMQFLGSALEDTWQPSTSQLYVLLKRLKQEELCDSRAEKQETRPSKRVFTLTDSGKRTFLAWQVTPVTHVRDFRMEFLCKMFFFDYLSLSGGKDLIKKQSQVLEAVLDAIKRKYRDDDSEFTQLVLGFKVRTVENLLSWLHEEASPFIDRKERKTEND
jgi:DNA-binding PadR family transcriptional regulator